MGKKQNEAVANSITDLMKTINKTVQDQGDKLNTPTIKTLDDLKNHYATVDLRIRKRDQKTGKFTHFVQMERQNSADLEATGLEEICKDQGGGGEYQVLAKDPNQRSWSGALRFDGIHVSGISYDTSKADRMGANSLPGSLPAGNGTPYNPVPYNFQKNEMKDVMKQQMEQSMGMNDRMLMLMQNNNQQQMQMMQAFMASMMGNQNRGGEDSEVRMLKERIERMEQERRSEERYAALAKEQTELRQQLLMAQHAPKQDNEFSKLLVAMLTGQQSSQQAANSQYVELVKEMMQRPSEDEKISNITGTMIRSFQGQMDLMNSALRNGLLSSGGPEHPVAQIVSQALEGLTQVATVAFENRGSRNEEPGYDTEPAEVGPMPGYETPAMGYIPPAPQLAAQATPTEPPPPPVVQEMEAEPEEEEEAQAPQIREEDILLNDSDLNRVARDTALSQVLAKIQNGVPITEATARLYAHARAQNDIAIKWLTYPDIISRQVLTYYGMEQYTQKLSENIVKFMLFLNDGGDPNDWAKETGYKPIKAPVPSVTSVIPPAPGPEFGMTRGEPQRGEEYDPEFPKAVTPEPPQGPHETQPETVDDMVPEGADETSEIPSSVAEMEAPEPEAQQQA